jgi:hypothetical protein
MEASVQAHQGDLLLMVPEPNPEPDIEGERWQFYFSQALDADGKNRDWAEGYATAQVKREQEQAERMGGGDPTLTAQDFMQELRAMKP